VIVQDAVQAEDVVRAVGAQVVHLVVADAEQSDLLQRPEVLVVQVGGEKPAADFGVLWRPARSTDEAVELGVEVARDLVLQGVGEILVTVAAESEVAEGLARGVRLGGLACGVAVRSVAEPAGMKDSSA
jgi:hypothetical protein